MINNLKFHYKGLFDDFDTEMKGYRNDVFVESPTGEIFEVFFYTATRLLQDMGSGEYLSQPGLIILKVVNKNNIEKSVNDLWRRGYFNYLKPISSIENKHFDEEDI